MSVSSLERPGTSQKDIQIKSLRTVVPSLKNILLCRKAYADEAGHNVYEGEFKTISVKGTPAVEREIFVVTKWGDGAGREFRQEIRIFDPAGNLQIFNSRDFEKEFHLGNIYHEHMIFGRVSGLLLPREGRYRVEVYLNGELKGKTYFNVFLRSAEEAVFQDTPEAGPETNERPARTDFLAPVLPLFRMSLNYLKLARD